MEVAPAAPGEFAPLQLGSMKLDIPVVLAPMAGVTNLPFRQLCREFGAGCYVSEMITARGYLNDHPVTMLLARSSEGESPRSVQIYGSDPIDVGLMVERLADEGVDHVDLNLGCPVRKVTANGGGSAIPVKPRLMARLVRAMVTNASRASKSGIPVTVKVRKGINDDLLTFLDAGRVAQEEGAASIGLHGRTAAQLYSGQADWNAIGELKSHINIPVLGNGDIWECFDALRMMRATGCDGVIVGRGCLGRPWLFRELAQVFAGQEPDAPPNLGQILEVMHRHAVLLCDFFGERLGIRQMRKWTSWYTKGFRGSAALRGELGKITSVDEMLTLMQRLEASEPFPLGALRANRAKGSRQQKVTLPHGFLDNREDDQPPKSAHTPEEMEAYERALQGG